MVKITDVKINIEQLIQYNVLEALDTLRNTHSSNDDYIVKQIGQAGEILIKALLRGNKILLCGNGGSAADCQHMAAEIVGRFEVERAAMPAISLTTDSSIITAIANDYGYEEIFSRQVEALANADDVLIAISTSGNSKNIIKAINVAIDKKMIVIGFSGNEGGTMQKILQSSNNINLCVASARTARIQEIHALWVHILCNIIDNNKNS